MRILATIIIIGASNKLRSCLVSGCSRSLRVESRAEGATKLSLEVVHSICVTNVMHIIIDTRNVHLHSVCLTHESKISRRGLM